MPASPYWQDDPDSWDRISIGGQLMPGLAKVKASIGRKLDVKAARGRDGARINDGGYENAKIDVEIRVNTKEDFDLLQPRLDALSPRQRGSARTAVDVAHPSLVFLGISSAYVKAIHAPELANDTLTVKIEMLEWTPQPRARPAGTTTPAGAATPDTIEQREARNRARAIPGSGPTP